jgi:hypothetical protein
MKEANIKIEIESIDIKDIQAGSKTIPKTMHCGKLHFK